MKIIASFKFLRGTLFDPFGYTQDRKDERDLMKNYKNKILEILPKLKPDNYKIACEIASMPNQIRGFGYIKKESINKVKIIEKNLISKF